MLLVNGVEAAGRSVRRISLARTSHGLRIEPGCQSYLSGPSSLRTPASSHSFSSTSSLRASEAEHDFYKTLEVGRNATQSEIKQQFYKLSKQWHPDRNGGSDDSKKHFQRVSEAYATLSHEQSRKQYDQQTSGSMYASRGGGSGSYAPRGFRSDNLQRKATASYAWEYQRRNAARAANRQASAGDAHYHHHGGGQAGQRGPGSTSTWGTGGAGAFGMGGLGGSGASATSFERLAEQQRKREAAMAARSSGASGSSSASNDAADPVDHSAGHLVRFLQIGAMLSLIGYVVSVFQPNDQRSARRRI